MEGEFMITFPNTHSAIRGEQALLRGEVGSSVMPMPSSVVAGCGICLRVTGAEIQQARVLLTEAGVLPDGCYRIERQDGCARYVPVS